LLGVSLEMFMKVCVIDDDPLMLEHIESMLVERGYQGVTADNVSDGLHMVREQRPDAVVIDILMPERDGLNFILGMQELLGDTRIVAMTGGGRLGPGPLLRMAEGLGAHASLTKPFSASELEAALTAPIRS
jgi:DNA-binding response OmpR family regulator